MHLLQALYCIVAAAGESGPIPSEHLRRQEQSQRLGQLHSYLLEHVDQKVSVGKAAAIAGMSESKFMRYFRTVTGETFVSYLTRLRLERAAQLLEETSLSIAEVASSVGFADQSYFDRVFRKHYGRTPSEVRAEQMEPRRVVSLR
jgi:transcriptional regulator GlxA family with amidase domain